MKRQVYKIKHIVGANCPECDLNKICFSQSDKEFEKLVTDKKLACMNGNLPPSFIYKRHGVK